MTTTSAPQLAPPGAGLPAIELFIARLLFRYRFWTGNRQVFTARFQAEREQIRALTGACDAETGARRVLIPRPRGLEDSSRHWSVWMVLDHLRIVNSAIARTIGALVQGHVPEHKASTAAVKPSPETDMSIAAAYEASCDSVLTAGTAPELETATARFAHPWFGPLEAREWYGLAGGHMGLHRAQIGQIVAALQKQKQT